MYLVDVLDLSTDMDSKEAADLSKQTKVIKYLSSMPTTLLHELVMVLQNFITINIISSGQFQPINIELISMSIKVLDAFHWVNKTFKPKEQ